MMHPQSLCETCAHAVLSFVYVTFREGGDFSLMSCAHGILDFAPTYLTLTLPPSMVLSYQSRGQMGSR